VRVIGIESLEDFCARHADARSQLDAWLCEAREARWQSSKDIKIRYTHATVLSQNRAIFNLKGSSYALEVKVNYSNQIVLIVGIQPNDDGMELLRRA
jgi:mRNA interferase HigB